MYSVLIKKWKVNPLHATAIVGTYSAIFYLPIYFIFFKSDYSLSPGIPLTHGIYQGGFASGLALYLFRYGVSTLGANRAGLYMPIVPALTTVLAVVFLKELPGFTEIAEITLIVAGFVFTVVKIYPDRIIKIDDRKIEV